MDTPRQPLVVHVDKVEPRIIEKGKRFSAKAKWLTLAVGAKGVGCSWYEVPSGKTAFPRHYHCANEETLFVLEGEGTVRIGNDEHRITAGTYVLFPVGPEHAHQVVNTGKQPLKYLCMSTLLPAEVVGYPDSKKIGAMARDPKGGPQPWIRIIVPDEAGVDYYEGEES